MRNYASRILIRPMLNLISVRPLSPDSDLELDALADDGERALGADCGTCPPSNALTRPPRIRTHLFHQSGAIFQMAANKQTSSPESGVWIHFADKSSHEIGMHASQALGGPRSGALKARRVHKLFLCVRRNSTSAPQRGAKICTLWHFAPNTTCARTMRAWVIIHLIVLHMWEGCARLMFDAVSFY